MATAAGLEARFFQTLNGFAEPAVRAGFGSPCLWPNGLIVIESSGRRSGRTYRSPVAFSRIGKTLIASTVRGDRSQWLKNLAATPDARYWLGGRAHDARAIVLSPAAPVPDIDDVPWLLRPIIPGLALLCSGLGMGFAVLIPRGDDEQASR